MRWTSWRDCEERSIGPDGYRLTGATHHFRSWLARPLAILEPPRRWRRSGVYRGASHAHPRAARPSKPSHPISSNVAKTAAGECDVWNGDELGDDLQRRIARALLQLDQIGAVNARKGWRARPDIEFRSADRPKRRQAAVILRASRLCVGPPRLFPREASGTPDGAKSDERHAIVPGSSAPV